MKKLGFGCMRLPMNGEEVDLVEFSKMVDEVLESAIEFFENRQIENKPVADGMIYKLDVINIVDESIEE